MDYQEAIRYLGSFTDYEKIGYKGRGLFNLERMRRLAGIFNNPQDSFPVIHISGTKGKGSVASFVSNILTEAGFSVGLYTSPHLVEPRERIKVNNEMINENDFSFYTGGIKRKLDSENLGFSPTYFEIYTLLAFSYLRARKIDYGVIEVGLGGRLDATNIVKPLVSVITPISYDHTHILGNNLGKIAFEKSGIIKKGCVCVSAPQKEEALEVIRKKCKSLNAPFILAGTDMGFKEIYHDSEREIFDIRGIFARYEYCTSRLLGRHQITNAACAVGAVESLAQILSTYPYQPRMLRGARLTESIKRGLKKAENPARCEVIAKNPRVVLDGAQNRASAKALKETIKRNFDYKRLILVLGISKGKDIRGVCEELAPLAYTVILTKANIERAEEPYKIKNFIKEKKPILTNSVKEALNKSRTLANARDMILITGSFFVLGELKKSLMLHFQHC